MLKRTLTSLIIAVTFIGSKYLAAMESKTKSKKITVYELNAQRILRLSSQELSIIEDIGNLLIKQGNNTRQFREVVRTILDLSNNQLTVAPDVRGLTKLQELGLDNNQLTVAPDVRALTKLQELGLSDNQLTVAPDVRALTNLQQLRLDYNQLSVAPDVSGLTKLQLLWLNDNQLTVAPDVRALTNLQKLGLGNNQLTAAPDVCALTKLQVLGLDNNQLTAAPDVRGLTNLQELGLSNNQLTAAPDVRALTNLRRLWFLQNPCGRTSVVRANGSIEKTAASLEKIVYNLAGRECITLAFKLAKDNLFTFIDQYETIDHRKLMILNTDAGTDEAENSVMGAKMRQILNILLLNLPRIIGKISELKRDNQHSEDFENLRKNLEQYQTIVRLIQENKIYLGNPADAIHAQLPEGIKSRIFSYV